MNPQRHNYENLEVYKRSITLAVEIITLTAKIKLFKLADQIAAAAVSIPSNIAEGAERGNNKEFKRFLEYSSGSAAELMTQLKILQLSERILDVDLEKLISETKEINAMIRGLINKFQ